MTNDDWYLYLVASAAGSIYTGISTDVSRRIAEHASGKGSKYLRGKGPLKLLLQRPAGNRSLASQLERQVKALSRQEKLNLIKYPETLDDWLIKIQNPEQRS